MHIKSHPSTPDEGTVLASGYNVQRIASYHSSRASFDPWLREHQWRAEDGSLRLGGTIGKTEPLEILRG